MPELPVSADDAETPAKSWRAGGCHCGAVRFAVLTADDVEVDDCNCSICRKSGYLHLIVAATDFRLEQGADKLTSYSFGTGAAKHLFCSVCGIKSFYVPRSNPDGYSMNLRCLDDPQGFRSIRVIAFDGAANWEGQAERLAHKSKPD